MRNARSTGGFIKNKALKMLFDMVETKKNYLDILMKRKSEEERGIKNDAL